MPKHLILFVAFLALLTAIFYHPIPDPELWDTSTPSWVLPELKTAPSSPTMEIVWPQKLKASLENLENTQNSEVLSALQ